MANRPCLDCGELTTRTRCPDCTRSKDHRRGNSTTRGYGAAYRRERVRVLAVADHCATCGERFTRDNPATGGHDQALRHGGVLAGNIIAECRRCNYGWRRDTPDRHSL